MLEIAEYNSIPVLKEDLQDTYVQILSQQTSLNSVNREQDDTIEEEG